MEEADGEFPIFGPITSRFTRRLPDRTADEAIYHVTFHQADSLPAQVIHRFQNEIENLKAQPGLTSADAKRLKHLLSERIEAYVDSGKGSCLMRRQEVAPVVVSAIQHFDHERYDLHAWCVMPNHVHLVIQPLSPHQLPKIVQSLKSFTAHEIRKLVPVEIPFWQHEYYDHLIRNAASYARVVEYVAMNPSKAGLRDWKWVYPE